MKIESQKDLAKLIALCRKQGVSAIKVGDIEFHLGAQPAKAKYVRSQGKTKNVMPQPIDNTPDEIETDELTPEQALFWSVEGIGQ